MEKDDVATDITPPDPGVVLDLIEAFRRSKAMFTAVSLGLFDALAEGPQSTPDLARQLQANPDALGRLLDACVGLRLLTREGDRYGNTPGSTHQARRFRDLASWPCGTGLMAHRCPRLVSWCPGLSTT